MNLKRNLSQLFLAITLLSIIGINGLNAQIGDLDPIRRFRAVYNSDAATAITIGFENVAGVTGAAGPKIYYSTTDHGQDLAAYEADNPALEITAQVIGRGMNNAFFQLTDLTPGMNYYFVISNGIFTTERFYVKTIPNDNNYRLKIIAGGDSRNAISTDPNAAILVEARQNANLLVKKMRADAIFFGGDMTLQDTETEWYLWLDHWQETIADDGYMTPIIPARGNHEYFVTSVYDVFYSPNTNSVYGVTFADDLLHLSTLNSETTIAGDVPNAGGFTPATINVEDQGAWLETELTEHACTYWKMAQYHRPTRPHESSKSLKDNQREHWSKRFDKYAVQVVCESDAHVTKYTHPIRTAATGEANGIYEEDAGFVRDDINGTTYIGEGGWGAELRPGSVQRYNWTIADASFNQFKLIFIDKEKMEIRNMLTDEASDSKYPFLSETDARFDMTPFEDLVWEYEAGKKIITVTNVTPPTEPTIIATAALGNGAFELDAGADYNSYAWSTGETTQKITVTNPGDYSVTVSNRAQCQQISTTTVSADALAVDLVTFTGKEYGKSNILNWQTAREIAHDFFVVEASTDGKNFIALGQLDGVGNTRTSQTYDFIDESPLAKRTFYRLQQVNLDGKVTYSDVIIIERTADFQLQIRRIVPNPVAENARLQFVSNSTQSVDYQVIGLNGQLKIQQTIAAQVGNNEVPVATADLAAGIYFVVLTQGNQTVSYRFVKK